MYFQCMHINGKKKYRFFSPGNVLPNHLRYIQIKTFYLPSPASILPGTMFPLLVITQKHSWFRSHDLATAGCAT